MPERPLGPADWLKKTVTDFDRAEAPKVEEVKKELIEEVVRLDPAAPPAAPAATEPVKVEEKATPIPPAAEVAPETSNAPASTVPPAVASPAPVVMPAPTVPPVSAQSPTSPLK
jgi:hypothetical protein